MDCDHGLSVSGLAKLLGIGVCCLPRPTSETDLVLMRPIDGLHLEHPSAVQPIESRGDPDAPTEVNVQRIPVAAG